ncbi:DUF11 domain-containing protein [Svornostia abyssi]|uniref:DUF11 domain-containing protein n=1 Tax=Svornostia abyssi TaxID=2898438 RepID=A0ABY5PLX8_9ACTN|nr:DUF11 domain-containing protein [Parviterribacteraceae bacterium J379]
MRLRFLTCLVAAAAGVVASPARAAPVPIVDCITPTGEASNLWWISFGYVNTGAQQFIDFGDQNQVVPGLGYQGQPTVFNTGSYPRVFRAVFNAEAFTGVSWELAGASATATLQSPRCLAGATGPASDVTGSSATLNGLVEPDGFDTAYLFDYGTTIAYGQRTPERRSSSASGVQVSAPLTGLQPGTTYHYRLVASGSLTSVGEDRTFRTPPAPVPAPTPPPDLPAPQNLAPAAVVVPAAGPSPTLTDLVLMRSGPRSRVRVGRTFTVRLTTTNRGPASATGAGLVHRLSDGLRLVSARGPAGRCWGKSTVRCPLGTVAAGQRITVMMRLRATRAGRLTDAATVAADQADTRVADNAVGGTLRARKLVRRR